MPKESIHARKINLVRREIAEKAFALFMKHGFDAVTFDDVATAAGVSRRTLFRYFETKEDIVVSQLEQFGERAGHFIALRPANERPATAVLRSMHQVLDALLAEPERLRPLVALIGQTPRLRARMADKHAKWTAALAAPLAKRMRGRRAAAAAAAIAATSVALFGLALNRWIEDGRSPLGSLLDECFADVFGS